MGVLVFWQIPIIHHAKDSTSLAVSSQAQGIFLADPSGVDSDSPG